MPTKMRLQRHGKKGKPFYHIVIADGRAPRDGRFIEKIGTYNPIPNPAEINLNADKALDWLQKGAQPTDTVRAILSYKGILYRNHLLKGVQKGALSEAEAEAKYQSWLKDKEEKIDTKRKGLEEKARAGKKEKLEAEAKIKEERAAELARQRMASEDAKAKESREVTTETAEAETIEATEEPITKEAIAEKVAEVKEEKTEVKAEEPVAEVKEEKAEAKAEAKEEEKTEVKVEEPVAEVKEEKAKEKKEDK